MTARNRDKIFELVKLKERPLIVTENSESFPGTNMPTENICTPVLLSDGQRNELNRKCPVTVGANICYSTKDFFNQNRGRIADGGGYCNTIKVPCSKTAFHFLVFIGIVAVLTVLAMTGLILAVLSRSELRKTERELSHKLILVSLTVTKLSSQISEQYKEIMQNIAKESQTTKISYLAADTRSNREAREDLKIRILDVNESINNNVDATQTMIRRINDQVNQSIGRILSNLDSTRNITAHVEIMANDASNKVNMLVGKNLISNCTSRKLQCNFVQDITSATSLAITEVLHLEENRVGQPACYISGGNRNLQMTASLRSEDANSTYCVCTAVGNISVSVTCELHYVECGIITIN